MEECGLSDYLYLSCKEKRDICQNFVEKCLSCYSSGNSKHGVKFMKGFHVTT